MACGFTRFETLSDLPQSNWLDEIMFGLGGMITMVDFLLFHSYFPLIDEEI